MHIATLELFTCLSLKIQTFVIWRLLLYNSNFSGIGLELKTGSSHTIDSILYVKSIRPGSAADSCKEISVGDRIVKVYLMFL